MKLIHVVSGMAPKAGGVSQAVRTMIKGLSAQGVVNEVVCMDNYQTNHHEDDDFVIYNIGPGKSAWLYNSNLLKWLKQNITHYDAVLIHGLWQYHTYAVFKVCKSLNEKSPQVFVMPHGMLDPWFQRAKERRLKAIRNWIFWKLIEYKIVNRATGLFFTSESERLLAKETFSPYYPKSEYVVGLGVQEPPLFTVEMQHAFYEKCRIPFNSRYLLFLSRIHTKKGIDLLVKAYISLKSEGYNLPQLVIAGPGLDTSFGLKIQQLAYEDKNIFFPGMLTGNAKWGAFYMCDAFILPSHQENFGIAIVEALACSKPVLISNQINIWTEIESGGGGIVENDTFEGVKLMLKKWNELSPAKKNDMSLKAKEIYTNNFTLGQAAKKLKIALGSNDIDLIDSDWTAQNIKTN